jgi:hypothetical protein
MRWTVVAGLAALGVVAARRIAELSEQEGRPLADVVSDLPGRLSTDLASVPDDVRMAVREGRLAAERRMRELDEQLRAAEAGGRPPTPPA